MITKAIIPAAGFGTRFLPQTKSMPKEMLPLIDKPIIQYVVEELVAAGIKDIIIVGSSNKRSIEDHFDMPNEDLLVNLRAGGAKKQHYIDMIEEIGSMANFIYVRQKGPYGGATPLLSAAHLIGDEPFIYKFADDFFTPEANATKQLITAHGALGGSGVFACKRVVSDKEYDSYGFASGEIVRDGLIKVDKIIEKPGKINAPSNLASVSGYVLTGELLRRIEQGITEYDPTKGEFIFQPFIQQMINEGHRFYAKEIEDATFYDTGNPLEYIKTVIDFGLRNGELSADLRDFISQKIS